MKQIYLSIWKNSTSTQDSMVIIRQLEANNIAENDETGVKRKGMG